MLDGIRRNAIIVGAYSNDQGICPMLAAHRAGGRTNFLSFARAWDRFAFRGARRASARRATDRELLVLVSQLEASLAEEGPDLSRAIAEHRRLVSTRPRPERPGDPDRTSELRATPGWAWLRATRRYDEYARALGLVEQQHDYQRSAS
jgi:hypothetical protein